MYVQYQDIGVERSHNKKLFSRLKGKLHISQEKLSRGRIFAYNLCDFFSEATRIFADDIYIWCKKRPKERPYTK